jgi:hypothetical protein
MRLDARSLQLLRQFVARDLRQRWLGSLSGGLWALMQPLAMLAIYAVVFVEILKVRLPERVGGDFVPFLVVALWPWTAFAEALNRAVNVFPENAGLLSKVACTAWASSRCWRCSPRSASRSCPPACRRRWSPTCCWVRSPPGWRWRWPRCRSSCATSARRWASS